LGDGEEIRRAYLGVRGMAWQDWDYILIIDFAKSTVHLRDVFISYTGFKPWTIRIGNMKEPLSIDHLLNDTNITFMERALPVNAFILDRRIGVNVNTYGQLAGLTSYTVSTGLFGVEPGHQPTSNYDDGYALDGRFTAAYLPRENQLIHLGVSGTVRKADSNKLLTFSSQPESNVTNVTFVNTGTVHNVDYYKLYDLEFVLQNGSLSFQGEYIWTDVLRQDSTKKAQSKIVPVDNPNLIYKGWYIYGSYFLTGEARPYDKSAGTFNAIKPCHDYGAWEIALRYSDVNLTSHPIIGGQEHNIAFALNWYVNEYVRFDANYIKVYANQGGLSNQPSVYTMRGQISFI
jgi:phosphate-selective porin OprO/OprP